MKIAIAGAGMAGSYLYRSLVQEGFGNIDLYEERNSTACGQRPCAWGFAPSSEYHRLLSRFIDADMFVSKHNRTITVNGVDIDADLLTVDKPALNRAMIGNAPVRYGGLDQGEYDRVIDATGVERAYLGPTEQQDLIADMVQYRLSTPLDLGLWINTSAIGYEWCFPLNDGQYHLGFGNLRAGTIERDLLRYLGDAERTIHCHCRSRLRLSSPYGSSPFVKGDRIVGVGESIGTVAPLGGDGNLYAMQCADLLIKHWDDLEGYSYAVLEKFDWMRKERLALERVMAGELPTPGDLRTFVHHAHKAGFGMGAAQAFRFFIRAIQSDPGPQPRVLEKGEKASR